MSHLSLERKRWQQHRHSSPLTDIISNTTTQKYGSKGRNSLPAGLTYPRMPAELSAALYSLKDNGGVTDGGLQWAKPGVGPSSDAGWEEGLVFISRTANNRQPLSIMTSRSLKAFSTGKTPLRGRVARDSFLWLSVLIFCVRILSPVLT